jgi:HK97 gp10 family phage protein
VADEFKIEGLEEVQRKLKELPEKFGKRGMRRALRKGANVVRDAARNNAKRIDDPATREDISKNIAVYSGGAKRESRAGGVMMRVGVRGGARPTRGDNGAPGGATWYWRLVEFGSSLVAARPFMRPALFNNAGRVADTVTQAAKVELDKELAKLK